MRVLHIELDSAMGGIESFLLNVYKNIDRDKIKFDFIEYGMENRDFDYFYTDMGAKIFKLSDRRKNPIKAILELKEIIKREDYKIVHIHKNSLADISAIVLCQIIKVPTIIIHSHNTNRDNKKVIFLHKLNRNLLSLKNLHCFACSKKAAEWMFGKKADMAKIISNGIDVDKFEYDKIIRERTRKELGLRDELVVGNVGRLTEQKNPLFMLKVFHELHCIYPNSKLLWVGDGKLKDTFMKEISKYGLEDYVIMISKVSNPEVYYQAMDMFVMPSLYEGFPIAAVEAQASGLPCVLSDSITNEVQLTKNILFKDLDLGEKYWAKEILGIIKSERISNSKLLKQYGFDIKDTAIFLQKFYYNNF